MEENFATLVQQLIARGQSQVSANLADDAPDEAASAIASAPAEIQDLIGQGQDQVRSSLMSDGQGFFNQDLINSFFEVGESDTDSVTGSGSGSSNAPAAFEFVIADSGTVDASGAPVFGQVTSTINGETTPLFTLGASGTAQSSSSDQSSDMSSFLTFLSTLQ